VGSEKFITRRKLKKSKPENVYRLARWLRLRTEGYSLNQTIGLIMWLLHPNRRWQRQGGICG